MKYKKSNWYCDTCVNSNTKITYRITKNVKCKNCGKPKPKDLLDDIPIKKLPNHFLKEYYMVVDFEANCSAQGIRDHEIIEFPAVLIQAKTGIRIAEFREFVQLVTHEKLSTFIKHLTHITDEEVNNGLKWDKCLYKFEEWCNQYKLTEENVTVITVGDWDLKTMLPRQLALTKTKLTKYLIGILGSWTNIKVYYKKHTGQNGGMDRMLKYYGLKLTGHHHSGIDDCRNTAKICQTVINNGYDITVPTGQMFYSSKYKN
jgi:inhibitor of KinA sporulation pathway (predicted exonuclease)